MAQRLVWGEVDLTARVIRLQPQRWIPDHQAWTPATDAFHEQHQGDWWYYPLPSDQPVKVDYTSAEAVAPLAKGWTIFKQEDLVAYRKPLDAEAALRYFDARCLTGPRLCPLPYLAAVSLAIWWADSSRPSAGKPVVALLLAAGCEGKTTALLQAAYSIVEAERLAHPATPGRVSALVPDEILPLLDNDYVWLLLLRRGRPRSYRPARPAQTLASGIAWSRACPAGLPGY